MGMLDRWFGGVKEYPPLAADSQARHFLDEISPELEGLAVDVEDKLEVVPCDHEAFVFIGTPPKRLGFWRRRLRCFLGGPAAVQGRR